MHHCHAYLEYPRTNVDRIVIETDLVCFAVQCLARFAIELFFIAGCMNCMNWITWNMDLLKAEIERKRKQLTDSKLVVSMAACRNRWIVRIAMARDVMVGNGQWSFHRWNMLQWLFLLCFYSSLSFLYLHIFLYTPSTLVSIFLSSWCFKPWILSREGREARWQVTGRWRRRLATDDTDELVRSDFPPENYIEVMTPARVLSL